MTETRVCRPIQREECLRLSEEGTGWIAKVIEADEEWPELEPYVVSYCPDCAEREFGA